jgi:Domain of unknown function (DUF1917)
MNILPMEWITFPTPGEENQSLDSFLNRYPPSKTSGENVDWISVRNSLADDRLDEDFNLFYAKWAILEQRKIVTLEDLKELAKQSLILSGKWLIFASPATVDELWAKIAEATQSGSLGCAAKVSPSRGKTHVICIYNDNFTDRLEVLRIRNVLRDLKVTWELGYKPDIFTYAGIYSGNKFKLPATIYRDLN